MINDKTKKHELRKRWGMQAQASFLKYDLVF